MSNKFRLAQLWVSRNRTTVPIKVIDGGHSDGWQPITRPQSPTSGLAPSVGQGTGWAQWEVVGQKVPRRQQPVADLALLYKHFTAQTERNKAWLFGRARQLQKYLSQQQ
jgi:hypothetical protein